MEKYVLRWTELSQLPAIIEQSKAKFSALLDFQLHFFLISFTPPLISFSQ